MQTSARPGTVVQKIISQIASEERELFLHFVETRAKLVGDLDIVEAIQDYRLLVRGKPYLRLVGGEGRAHKHI
jgi:hypothetical protein